MLTFWTNGDRNWIDRLYRRSALMRAKWDERHAADGATYGEMTIAKALGCLARDMCSPESSAYQRGKQVR
jgi:putative DNA primase/helicase